MGDFIAFNAAVSLLKEQGRTDFLQELFVEPIFQPLPTQVLIEQEPLPADHPLKRTPNTVLTPHLGYVTDHNFRLWYGQCVEDIVAWLDGKPVRVLNLPPA